MRAPFVVALAAPIALAACGSDGGGATVGAPAVESGPGTLTLASGAGLDRAELAGQDVLLWFWAPW